MSIVAEAPDFIQVFSNGNVKRFAPEIAPASPQHPNANDKYKSKDITIDASKPITARIFLPDHTSKPQTKLPILIYFHGGGFCIGSTTWLGYHVFLGDLSATANIIILSIDYRLAPENKLPTAYEDCYTALQWLSSNADHDPWLQHADLSRTFLSGDSAGGNIAHHITIKTIKHEIRDIKIKGLLPIHPYFGSENRTELEMLEGSQDEVAMNDMFWKLSLPEGLDRDFYGCNMENAEAEWRFFPAVLVFIAGLDFLKERGVMYAEFLKRKGVENVSLVEAEDEKHVFHVWDPKSEATSLIQKQISEFIQSL